MFLLDTYQLSWEVPWSLCTYHSTQICWSCIRPYLVYRKTFVLLPFDTTLLSIWVNNFNKCHFTYNNHLLNVLEIYDQWWDLTCNDSTDIKSSFPFKSLHCSSLTESHSDSSHTFSHAQGFCLNDCSLQLILLKHTHPSARKHHLSITRLYNSLLK